MDRDKLADWCEHGILGLVLGILVVTALLFGGTGEPVVFGGLTGGWHFLPAQGLTALVLGLWCLRLWLAPKAKFLWPPACWAVVAFVCYAGIRYASADVEYPARQEFLQVLVYGFLFVAILNQLHRQEATHTVALTLVFLAMVLAAYAIYQCVMKDSRVWTVRGPYPGRGTGTFINPNNLAAFLELILPMAISYVMAARLGALTKVLLGYAALVILVGIGVTASRGAYASTGLMLLVICGVLLSQRNYRPQAVLLLVVLGVVGRYLLPRVSMIQTRLSGPYAGNYAGDMRWSIWRGARDIWLDHWAFGVGPAQFDPWFSVYRPTAVQMRPLLAHNDYLNTLADYGLVGAGLILATLILVGLGVVGSWRFVRGSRDDFARKQSSKFAFTLGAIGGVLAILVHAAMDYNLHAPAVALVLVAWLALLTSQWRFATEQFWFSTGTLGRVAATIVLLGGAGVLVATGGRAVREETALAAAARTPSFSHARIAALVRATAAEDRNGATDYAIAECYRRKCLDGGDQYVDFGRQALGWYRRAMALNPHDANAWLGYGDCVDFLDTPGAPAAESSDPYFQHALELDPNGENTSTMVGRHWIHRGDYAAARACFERSLRLQWLGNEPARKYLEIVEQRLREAAAGPEVELEGPPAAPAAP